METSDLPSTLPLAFFQSNIIVSKYHEVCLNLSSSVCILCYYFFKSEVSDTNMISQFEHVE